ncbi:MAG: peptidylprolyl isomerase [Bacteroidales bacterium]|nr:peptidylprolyl isomerase [Bacteroidales bacterium]
MMAKVKISTVLGDITVRLYDETPAHRDNFIKLAKEGFYNGTLFHRVIKDFMIQGGDPESKGAPAGRQLGSGDAGYTLPAEFNPSLFHKRGALSAARLGDNVNPERRSSGCQFYIVWGKTYSPAQLARYEMFYGPLGAEKKEAYTTVGGTPFLDGQYTVFGEVESGLEIVGDIQESATDANDRPLQDIAMTVTVIED